MERARSFYGAGELDWDNVLKKGFEFIVSRQSKYVDNLKSSLIFSGRAQTLHVRACSRVRGDPWHYNLGLLHVLPQVRLNHLDFFSFLSFCAGHMEESGNISLGQLAKLRKLKT